MTSSTRSRAPPEHSERRLADGGAPFATETEILKSPFSLGGGQGLQDLETRPFSEPRLH